jgi:hypothetical protein
MAPILTMETHPKQNLNTLKRSLEGTLLSHLRRKMLQLDRWLI